MLFQSGVSAGDAYPAKKNRWLTHGLPDLLRAVMRAGPILHAYQIADTFEDAVHLPCQQEVRPTRLARTMKLA